jgi:feruloyl-CoA synthase
VWPELADHRPVIVDWLPWSHVMGGSHLFGMILRNGGTLYVDAGRPVGSAYAETVRTLREISPTMYFSVPRGFAMLLDVLRADESFAHAFFRRLRSIGNAAAALPNPMREELIAYAQRYGPGPIRVSSSWGMTETAPFATTSWGAKPPDNDTIGVPIPGVEIKLAPVDGRYELRIKGPNITPGYWRNAAATAVAFDADGYLRTGDAAALKDPSDPARGLVFGGRLAENFKLSTGTWVNVGALRLALIEGGAPLIEDVVFTGHDGEEIGVLIFLRAESAAEFCDAPNADHAELAAHERVRNFIAHALHAHNAEFPASSTRIARALILPEPPDRAQGEVTDKGSINQRRALALRAAFVTRLTASPLDTGVVLPRSRPATVEA